jgi:hypothetical protein
MIVLFVSLAKKHYFRNIRTRPRIQTNKEMEIAQRKVYKDGTTSLSSDERAAAFPNTISCS